MVTIFLDVWEFIEETEGKESIGTGIESWPIVLVETVEGHMACSLAHWYIPFLYFLLVFPLFLTFSQNQAEK